MYYINDPTSIGLFCSHTPPSTNKRISISNSILSLIFFSLFFFKLDQRIKSIICMDNSENVIFKAKLRYQFAFTSKKSSFNDETCPAELIFGFPHASDLNVAPFLYNFCVTDIPVHLLVRGFELSHYYTSRHWASEMTRASPIYKLTTTKWFLMEKGWIICPI